MGKVVSFSFHCPEAQSVTLAGDFNNWNASDHPMVYDGPLDIWTVGLPLEPGRYEYKFFVDGRVWWNDPSAPKIPNVWGSENSYRDVEQGARLRESWTSSEFPASTASSLTIRSTRTCNSDASLGFCTPVRSTLDGAKEGLG